MSARLKPVVIVLLAMFTGLGLAGAACAATVYGVLPFQDTGNNVASHYAKGRAPTSELLQASDGNFYGTTANGGSGPCPYFSGGGYTGCGTVFQVNAKTGVETVIYNFPFDTATNTAPDGAYPLAGLIQGKDGALYGATSDGGVGRCNGQFGCGTLFRISPAGGFTLLHQFCGGDGCTGIDEGGHVISHLVQGANGLLYGTSQEGGQFGNYGTLFSATTSGAVTTLHSFQDGGGDGFQPMGSVVIGANGTLYGTTVDGGASNIGTVFSYGASGYTIIHSFDSTGYYPMGALIFGADGLLYGTTSSGPNGGTLYALNTGGGAYALDVTFQYGEPVTGLLLGSDGMMYGTLLSSNVVSQDGGLFMYNPTTKAMQAIVAFDTDTGAAPQGALIEGKDRYLYGSNSLYGGSNSLGTDAGTLYRVGPPLAK